MLRSIVLEMVCLMIVGYIVNIVGTADMIVGRKAAGGIVHIGICKVVV